MSNAPGPLSDSPWQAPDQHRAGGPSQALVVHAVLSALRLASLVAFLAGCSDRPIPAAGEAPVSATASRTAPGTAGDGTETRATSADSIRPAAQADDEDRSDDETT